jgi:hypothetical protein
MIANVLIEKKQIGTTWEYPTQVILQVSDIFQADAPPITFFPCKLLEPYQ